MSVKRVLNKKHALLSKKTIDIRLGSSYNFT